MKNVVALMYDFDKTLSPRDMQEYGFIPSLGYSRSQDFWEQSQKQSRQYNMDHILSYMKLMLDQARISGKEITREWFYNLGKDVELFPGVSEWFDMINEEGNKRGLVIEHYIVSSGLKEIIEGTPIACAFKEIYACEYMYENDVATWPAQAVNYTTKTQYIFRINKGALDVNDNHQVNAYVPHRERKIPFENMIYVGDGITDVPCMRLVKNYGGHSIAIYNEGFQPSIDNVQQLLRDKRVNFSAKADYRADQPMHQIVCAILDQVKANVSLSAFE